jgi:hypothetical protein
LLKVYCKIVIFKIAKLVVPGVAFSNQQLEQEINAKKLYLLYWLVQKKQRVGKAMCLQPLREEQMGWISVQKHQNPATA